MAFYGTSTSHSRAYTSTIGQKTGVFQPVTGQAVVVQTTAADDDHAADMFRKSQKNNGRKGTRFPMPEKDIVSRVESHTICFKKKGKKPRNARGAACDLPVFSALNGMNRREILETIEAVGIVQTPVNPNDKTKPVGFRTNATRIGGTVSTINTGSEPIEANVPVYWDVPHREKVRTDKMDECDVSECGQIKGHPQGIIYAATRPYKSEKLADALVEATLRHIECDANDVTEKYMDESREAAKVGKYGASGTPGNYIGDAANAVDLQNKFAGANASAQLTLLKRRFQAAIESRNRIIGWSLNYAAPGEQLDLILKK